MERLSWMAIEGICSRSSLVQEGQVTEILSFFFFFFLVGKGGNASCTITLEGHVTEIPSETRGLMNTVL